MCSAKTVRRPGELDWIWRADRAAFVWPEPLSAQATSSGFRIAVNPSGVGIDW
jgi:hypothetical protein